MGHSDPSSDSDCSKQILAVRQVLPFIHIPAHLSLGCTGGREFFSTFFQGQEKAQGGSLQNKPDHIPKQ